MRNDKGFDALPIERFPGIRDDEGSLVQLDEDARTCFERGIGSVLKEFKHLAAIVVLLDRPLVIRDVDEMRRHTGKVCILTTKEVNQLLV